MAVWQAAKKTSSNTSSIASNYTRATQATTPAATPAATQLLHSKKYTPKKPFPKKDTIKKAVEEEKSSPRLLLHHLPLV